MELKKILLLRFYPSALNITEASVYLLHNTTAEEASEILTGVVSFLLGK